MFINKVNPYLYITPEIEKAILEEPYEKSIYITDEMFIDNSLIKIIPTSHDAITSNGYLIETEEESVVYITDTGYINLRYMPYLTDKTYYILESNHDTERLINGPYPEYLQRRVLSDKGHLSNELCAGYLSKMVGPHTKKIILAHLSEINNTEEIALDTTTKILKDNNIDFNEIICAKQYDITEVNI